MSEAKTPRTWGDGWYCDECCNGDRCDDPSHVDRAHCPHCKGTGLALWNIHAKKRQLETELAAEQQARVAAEEAWTASAANCALWGERAHAAAAELRDERHRHMEHAQNLEQHAAAAEARAQELEKALKQFADCDLNESNCDGLATATKRIRTAQRKEGQSK